MTDLKELLDSLRISVQDTSLLQLALTHRSYINEHADENADNERLEFLGDAVLDFIVGAYLYRTFPEMDEGEMTALRAALVRAETLATFAQQLTIDHYLRLGFGEEEQGGRNKTPTLCAAFEAVIGALYLDQGLEPVRELVERLITPTLATIREQSLHKDAKSEFQVWAQARYSSTPQYRVVAEQGPDHEKTFTVQVIVNDEIWGEGEGSSKRRAAQSAAANAMLRAEDFVPKATDQ